MNLSGKGVTVFCSSSDAVAPVYRRAAAELAQALVARGATVVYGGASVGLMGILANTAVEAGGRVVGVIPKQLAEKEIAHAGLAEQHVVDTMHQRKTILSERASAYVVLPGGFGTYEEFFEVVAWRQLEIHDKPIILMNVEGFFDPILTQIDRAICEKMIKPEYAAFVQTARSVEEAMRLLEADPTPTGKVETWI